MEQALKNHDKESQEYQALVNLRTLTSQVEETLDRGVKAFGKGVFKLFDFVKDSLPDKDVSQLRYYNRRSFAVFDKYLQLREIHKELIDNIR